MKQRLKSILVGVLFGVYCSLPLWALVIAEWRDGTLKW